MNRPADSLEAVATEMRNRAAYLSKLSYEFHRETGASIKSWADRLAALTPQPPAAGGAELSKIAPLPTQQDVRDAIDTALSNAAKAEMVNRFLAWRLPQDFAPDAGVSFVPPTLPSAWPIGTNLLTAGQALAMLDEVTRVPLQEEYKRGYHDGLDDAAPAVTGAQHSVDGFRWDLLPSYLIDHCEGDTISEEGLQDACAAMLRDPKYSSPTPAADFTERHGIDLRGIKIGEVLTAEQWEAVCAFVREQDAIISSHTPAAVPDAEDMENVGRSLMEAIRRNLPDYAWNESPAEVVCDLLNQAYEARTAAVPDAVRGLVVTDSMCDDALMSRAKAEDTDGLGGDYLAMLIDCMGMGTPERLPKARRIVRAALEAALSAAPDGCGACGDGCKDRSGCRLAEDSPKAAAQEFHPSHSWPGVDGVLVQAYTCGEQGAGAGHDRGAPCDSRCHPAGWAAMSGVQRFIVPGMSMAGNTGQMRPHPDGGYVLYDDFARVSAELAAAREELARLKADCRSVYDAIPGLPIEQTPESCEAATAALHAFCLLIGVHWIEIGQPDAALQESRDHD